jgi:putative effector of murein hydrolase LrgA (UPF0299 family)
LSLVVVTALRTSGAIAGLTHLLSPLLAAASIDSALILPTLTKYIGGGTAMMGVMDEMRRSSQISIETLNASAGFLIHPFDIPGVAVLISAGKRIAAVWKPAALGACVGIAVHRRPYSHCLKPKRDPCSANSDLPAIGESLPTVSVPGPVIGMLLLFAALVLRGGADKELQTTSQTLLQHLSLLFVPAGTGVMLHLHRVADEWVALLASLLISTLATLIVTALVMKLCLGNNAKSGESA